MRYYSYVLSSNSGEIEAKTKVRLKEYSYENTLNAINNYMYRNLKNSITFFAYREENNMISAAFSYDEITDTFQNAYGMISEMLEDLFCISQVQDEPAEVTTFQFLDYLLEARRREYVNSACRIRDNSNLWIYDYYNVSQEKDYFHYEYEEKIISDKSIKKKAIYDQSFLEEIKKIEEHANDSDIIGNAFHYVISARSMEAITDMTETLMQKLLEAKRISSRRMAVISEMKPDVFAQQNNHLEELIENNQGGVIVFDLTEKYGKEATAYFMVSQYLERLLKKYHNKCLFVFTYNMDHPGFSYQLLPNLRKYVVPIALREGSGNRRTAINYMKELILKSEYKEYADQAEEYMKLYPGEIFTQTDVLIASEKFESWCLSKNILHVPYDNSDEFLLDRDENEESAYEKLQKLIGLDIVKKQIDNIISNFLVEKERKKRCKNHSCGCMHMVFAGNPGVAKTTVAKLLAGIGKEKGLLKSGAFVECGGMDLDNSPEITVRNAFLAAKGGVLFIDECYSMRFSTTVTVLLQEMENQREDVIVILAGYNDGMKYFMNRNEGLKSRVPYWIEFPDYTEDELTEIFKSMIAARGFRITDEAVEEANYIFSKVRYRDNFGNGRYVRNLIDHALQKQSVRLLKGGKDAEKIRKKELFLIKKEDVSDIDEDLKKERPAGSASNELNQMIGLKGVKDVIHKAVASFKVNKICRERGIIKTKASYHMVFTGNPGTAKTTVARLFAEILKDEKVLPTGNFIEAGRADIISPFVNCTAPLVKEKFREARGGVLFIDEAYSLCDYQKNGAGDEAINTIVQEMENHREDVVVIFAGYPEQMKEFLERNPGMSSRIAFHVNFEDYSVDELSEITELMISKKQFHITDDAKTRLREVYEIVSKEGDFGNGRFVRKILEEAEMNLAIRVGDSDPAEITTEMLTTIEECDIPKSYFNVDSKQKKKAKIGFAS